MIVSWKGQIMRGFLLVTVVTLFGTAAQADTTHWTAVHPGQDNSQLSAASLACGGDPVGVPTTAAYKRCMRSQGWIYTNTTRDNAGRIPPGHFLSPYTGAVCHNTGWATICDGGSAFGNWH
jgi:hypothetical protein